MAPRETEASAPNTREPEAAPPTMERALPSGRRLALRIGSAGEEIEIRSPAGDIEVRIVLTDAGPVVSLRGARLEVDAADVAFRCRDFDVEASGTARVASACEIKLEANEIRAQTEQDIHLNGAFIRLNCTPEGEAAAQALLAKARAAMETAGEAQGPTDPCG
jgi:hypothetical protein